MQHDNTDLEHLNFTELLEERAAVRARIREIIAEKAVTGRPDDHLYRKWLRRINAEQSAMADRSDQIKVMLAKRQHEHASTKGPKEPLLTPEQHRDLEERRRKLREDLAAGGPDALLIRCRRVFNSLCDGIPYDDLPLDGDDRETLRDVSVYLRGRYGSTPVKEATHGGAT
jgi:hypothetical protein